MLLLLLDSVSLMVSSPLCSEERVLSLVPLVAERLSLVSRCPSFPTLMLLSMLVAENVVTRWRKCCVISLNLP